MFSNGILIFDGGIGTELYERGFYINRPFEELNLSAPADVQAVHEAYIAAGSQVITTNTFSILRPQLKKFDIDDKQKVLVEAALRIANTARRAHPTVKVAFSMGPTGELIEPLGPTSRTEARAAFTEAARAAVDSGEAFDLYTLETFSNVSEMEAAIEGVRSVDAERPILASVTVMSSQTAFLQDFVDRISSRSDIQAIGFNCSQGPSDLYTILKKVIPLVDKPIVVQPNAGVPNQINGRYFYMTSPDYLAKYAKRYVEAGARGIGGCCGTGPDHIRAIRNSVQMMNSRRVETVQTRVAQGQAKERPQHRSWAERPESHIGAALATGQKVRSIEILPPKGTDLTKFLSQLDLIEKHGIHFVNVPDGARASTRVGSLHLAAAANRNTQRKLRVFPHFTTRDRNLIALQSDLLGAYINGVTDVLVVTGDPPKLGNNRDATAVYDIDSIGLTYLMDCLNRGVSPNGDNLGKGTNFGIGVAANPTAINLDLEVQRWRYKCESGADFAVTQPIFDAESYLRWRERVGDSWRPHLVGIWPLVSLRNTEFLANEVPGISVPASVVDAMAKAGDNPSECIKRGLDIARRTMEAIDDACEGFCVSAPLGKVEVALELFK